MTVNLAIAAKNAACSAIAALINTGSAQATGEIAFYTSGFSTLLTRNNFSNPAFGSPSSGEATASSIASSTTVANGKVAAFKARDRDLQTVLDGTCGIVGTEDIVFDIEDWLIGDTINLPSLKLKVP